MSVVDPSIPVRHLLGVKVHAVTMAQAVEVCGRAVEARERLLVGVVNAAKIVNMGRQPILREAVLAADLTIADGMAVVWAARLLGQPLPERVAGIDLFTELLKRADEKGYSVYLLGAEQGVLDEVVKRIEREHPGVKIAGARNGYFSDDEAGAVAGAIGAARPDLLFVAMTSPRKEVFLAKYEGEMNISVCHGVGGSFDVMAGKVKRAPRLWQRLGLEWLYRVVQEPGRMWKRYLVTNTLFVWMVLRALPSRGRVSS